GGHHMGTLRMAEDEVHGVVDRNCRVFGMDNLYVAGSAVFPTSSHANPTLTLVALSARLAEHLRGLDAETQPAAMAEMVAAQ
ncbi:MAG TPA: GMC family oxidoreductase, partial [Magnetospirillum sp.]|nr:GMC family oxidoreductase [Magnetospirillum sp.]